MIRLGRVKSGKRVLISIDNIAWINETDQGCMVILKTKTLEGKNEMVFVSESFDDVSEAIKLETHLQMLASTEKSV